MIEFSKGNCHDIHHFMQVHAYAKTIGECEGISQTEQTTLEIAAIIHDIACPLCREKYGNSNWKCQETEGIILAGEFLKEFELPEAVEKRIIYLVGHHHTMENIDGINYQILLEADYLVNVDNLKLSGQNIRNMKDKLFRTPTGLRLLQSVYGI